MRMNELGRTGLKVSELCLGSMTWGTQNTMDEGHAQIDMALDNGINFVDTAEMYPVNPVSAETIGDTEVIIGEWFAKTQRRSEVILATKMSGLNRAFVRAGEPINAKTIAQGLEGSLKRLKTDYVDLYQLHWPNRGSYMFRQNWDYDPSSQDRDETIDNMHEVLGALGKMVDDGKVRHVGLSNESAWGTAMWLRASEEGHGPRMASIQNEYSFLCRMFDTDLSELCVNEDVGLLAFSPLATGLLTGKYKGDVTPKGSRRAIAADLGGRVNDRVWGAVSAYEDIADRHGLNISQMALAWCRTRPFMASAIFGATSLDQLKVALGSVDVELSDEVLAEISTAHRAHPMPY